MKLQGILFVGYARKSTDTEDKQVQSIESQLFFIKKTAKLHGLKLDSIFSENKSAKRPGIRDEFTKMVNKIRGEDRVRGIVTWNLDRLSRNPTEQGLMMQLLQDSSIDYIVTNNQIFTYQDSGLIMSVMGGMNNQYILDLSRNVKRGLKTKYMNGWYPCHSPLGYKNDKLTKTIVLDDERFWKVRKIWDLIIEGHKPELVSEIMNDQYNFKTRPNRKTNNNEGKQISRSTVYKIIKNPFYAGFAFYDGKKYKLKHKPMVTEDEFYYVQKLISNPYRFRKHSEKFKYTGLIRCGECDSFITAEEKRRYNRKERGVKKYLYYHCTKRKKGVKCSQKSVQEHEIHKQLLDITKSVFIPEEIVPEIINNFNQYSSSSNNKVQRNNEDIETKRQKLIELYINEEISKKEFEQLKKKYDKSLHDSQSFIEKKVNAEQRLELFEKVFKLASVAYKSFEEGDRALKHRLIKALTSSVKLYNGKLIYELRPCFQVINNAFYGENSELLGLEPPKLCLKHNLDVFREKMLPGRDSNPRPGG